MTPPLSPPPSLRPLRQLKIGLVGAGFAGCGVHIPGWSQVPAASVTAVCDPDPDALARAAALVPGATLFKDHRALLAHGVDVVSVCAPNVFHASIAQDALRAGVHAFVEKPLGVTAAEVRALGAALGKKADARGLVLMTRHQLRFDIEAEAARARVAAIGPIRHINARALRCDRIPTTPSLTDATLAGGGAALDLGVHVLDMALWLTGGLVGGLSGGLAGAAVGLPSVAGARVSGRVSAVYGRGEVNGYRNAWGDWDRERFSVEDSASADITFTNGTTLNFKCAWAGAFTTAEEGTWCELIGERGSVRWEASPTSNALRQAQREARQSNTPPPDFSAFAAACGEGCASPVPWRETIVSLELIEALYQSAREGRDVIVGTP